MRPAFKRLLTPNRYLVSWFTADDRAEVLGSSNSLDGAINLAHTGQPRDAVRVEVRDTHANWRIVHRAKLEG